MIFFADAGTKDWYLVNSVFIPSAIDVVYLWFVLIAGPKWMQNRKPYNIKSLIMVYNVVQIIFNIYLLKEVHFIFSHVFIRQVRFEIS